MKNKYVIIMRGVPGSGKSTISNLLSIIYGAVIHSTDNYHVQKINKIKYFFNKLFIKNAPEMEYKFNRQKLGTYHCLNFESFCESCHKDIPMIVVDNTNVWRKFYMDYIYEGKANNYKIVDIKFEPNDIDIHMKRNVHNVPQITVEKMINALKSNWDNKDFDISIEIKKNDKLSDIENKIKEVFNDGNSGQ